MSAFGKLPHTIHMRRLDRFANDQQAIIRMCQFTLQSIWQMREHLYMLQPRGGESALEIKAHGLGVFGRFAAKIMDAHWLRRERCDMQGIIKRLGIAKQSELPIRSRRAARRGERAALAGGHIHGHGVGVRGVALAPGELELFAGGIAGVSHAHALARAVGILGRVAVRQLQAGIAGGGGCHRFQCEL